MNTTPIAIDQVDEKDLVARPTCSDPNGGSRPTEGREAGRANKTSGDWKSAHEAALLGLAHVLVHVQGIDGPSDASQGSEAEAAHASDHGQGVITTRQEGNRGDECPTEGGKAESANAHGSPSNPAELLEGGDAGRSSAEVRRLTTFRVDAAPGLGVAVESCEMRLAALVAQMDVGRIGARRGVVLRLHWSALGLRGKAGEFALASFVDANQGLPKSVGRLLGASSLQITESRLPARADSSNLIQAQAASLEFGNK